MVTVVLFEPAGANIAGLGDNSTIELASAVIAEQAWWEALQDAHSAGRTKELQYLLEELDPEGETDPSGDTPLLESLRACKGIVADRVSDALNRGPQVSREWDTTHTRSGGKLHVTGGMTWGDDPTDAFYYWNVLFRIDVDDAIYRALGYADL